MNISSRKVIPSKKSLRYSKGQQITTDTLIADSTNYHWSLLQQRGAFGLRAITGDDMIIDPDLDFFANLDAIKFWQNQKGKTDILSETGWAYWGKVLPEPQLG